MTHDYQATNPDIDEALWVELSSCSEEPRHYLVGSAHTFPGRMLAWCPAKRRSVMISKSEIVACSQQSAYWIAGFLHGSAPDEPLASDGDYLPADDPAVLEWLRAIEEFPRSGFWWVGEARNCEACGVRLLPTHAANRCCACDVGAG